MIFKARHESNFEKKIKALIQFFEKRLLDSYSTGTESENTEDDFIDNDSRENIHTMWTSNIAFHQNGNSSEMYT